MIKNINPPKIVKSSIVVLSKNAEYNEYIYKLSGGIILSLTCERTKF